ncbi:MAG: class I SAM-dependent methyltransferase [Verrucomicrobiota bacterium]
MSSPLTAALKLVLGKLGYTVKRRRPGRATAGVASDDNVEPANLMAALHGRDIYEGFDFHAIPEDLVGWGSDSPAFAELVAQHQPRFVIEVGTWKGGSALSMARAMKQHGGGVILCIDTWLGALEFWSDKADPERFQALECKHGYPSVYYRFLANVCHQGQQDVIVPFPLHSASAALWLLRHGLAADLCYLDGSHEEEDIYQDLLDYSQLTHSGGILFGDDWSWSGVQAAVKRFAGERQLPIQHCHDKWVLEMP